MHPNIRPVIKEDLPRLKAVIDGSELFPSELLDGMMEDYFTQTNSTDHWITYVAVDKPVAIAYCAPERMTEGTYNVYLIAVAQSQRGKGIGEKLMSYFEAWAKGIGGRILIVETSSLPEFARTREFYLKLGYTHEATIREFYTTGEDKVVFWKKL